MLKKKVILSSTPEGALTVYTMRSKHEEDTGAEMTNFWWHHPTYGEHGGFSSMAAAMVHYKSTVFSMTVSPAVPYTNNVIHVDFKAKRRL